jgi:hypothetical protein
VGALRSICSSVCGSFSRQAASSASPIAERAPLPQPRPRAVGPAWRGGTTSKRRLNWAMRVASARVKRRSARLVIEPLRPYPRGRACS